MKKIISLWLIVAMLLTALPAMADNVRKSGNFSYEIKGNGTAVITDYNCSLAEKENDIFIPDLIDGYTVTGIGEKAFAGAGGYPNDKRPSIHLPEGITTIGDFAFDGAGFSEINIPDSVQSIGIGAFDCYRMGGANVKISLNHPYFALIEDGLYNKQKKELIAYFGYYDFNDEWPTLTIPEGIVSIGDYALYDMEFEGIYIYFPSTLAHIGNHALENTNFLVVEGSSVANVKTIGECAFKDASYSTRDSRDYNVEVHFHSVETIGKQAFMGSRWEKICFENAPITVIPDEAFFGFEIVSHEWIRERITEASIMCDETKFPTHNIKTIGINNTQQNYGGFGFLYLSESDFSANLTTIPTGLSPMANSLPETVTEIQSGAFLEVRENFVLPASLQYIAEDAFMKGSTFIVEANSYALHWCKDNGFGYKVNGEEQNLDWLNN